MSISELQVNDPVVLDFLGSLPEGYEDCEVPAQIEGTVIQLSRSSIQVELHRPFRAVLALQPGDPFRLSFSDVDRVYTAETRLIEARGFVQTRFLLQKPSCFQPSQRRRFFRAPAAIQFAYQVIADDDDTCQKTIYTAMTLDISGGGIRFESPVELPPETPLKILFMPRGGTRKIEALARVVRVPRRTRPYEVAVELTEISERDRTLLMRCLFEWEAELRRIQLVERED